MKRFIKTQVTYQLLQSSSIQSRSAATAIQYVYLITITALKLSIHGMFHLELFNYSIQYSDESMWPAILHLLPGSLCVPPCFLLYFHLLMHTCFFSSTFNMPFTISCDVFSLITQLLPFTVTTSNKTVAVHVKHVGCLGNIHATSDWPALMVMKYAWFTVKYTRTYTTSLEANQCIAVHTNIAE